LDANTRHGYGSGARAAYGSSTYSWLFSPGVVEKTFRFQIENHGKLYDSDRTSI
jgi:hypothetical protein